MTGSKPLVLALSLFWGVHASTHAQPEHGASRGELLYAMHCSECHTSKIHWRDQKLATDWNSLKGQVRFWQSSIGLDWSEEEITDVTNYLNTVNYGFPVTEQEVFLQKKRPNPALRQY